MAIQRRAQRAARKLRDLKRRQNSARARKEEAELEQRKADAAKGRPRCSSCGQLTVSWLRLDPPPGTPESYAGLAPVAEEIIAGFLARLPECDSCRRPTFKGLQRDVFTAEEHEAFEWALSVFEEFFKQDASAFQETEELVELRALLDEALDELDEVPA